MKVNFIDVRGVRTRFYEAGSGEHNLVLVHGVGVSSDSWMRNIEVLGKDFHVYAIDLIGCGFSESGNYRSGPPQPRQVEHLTQFMDTVGIDHFSIAGSSLGAWIAALVCLERPNRLRKFIIVGCGTLLSDDLDRMGPGIARAYANGRQAYANNTYESCLQRMKNLVFDPSAIPNSMLYLQLTSNALPWALDAYDTRMRGLANLDAGRPYAIGPRLNEIACPKLILWGAQDPRGPLDSALKQFGSLPNGRFVTFENCGHFPFLEHPEKFNREVRDFLLER